MKKTMLQELKCGKFFQWMEQKFTSHTILFIK